MISANTKKENESIYVLHTYPFKETSLIAELFSKNYGRISVIAKGARRPRSSLRGMLQSFQLLEATWSGKNEIIYKKWRVSLRGRNPLQAQAKLLRTKHENGWVGGSAPPHPPFPVGRCCCLPGPGPWALAHNGPKIHK